MIDPPAGAYDALIAYEEESDALAEIAVKVTLAVFAYEELTDVADGA